MTAVHIRIQTERLIRPIWKFPKDVERVDRPAIVRRTAHPLPTVESAAESAEQHMLAGRTCGCR